MQTKFIRIGVDLVLWAAGSTREECDLDLEKQEDPPETCILEVPASFDITNIDICKRKELTVERSKSGTFYVKCPATGDVAVI